MSELFGIFELNKIVGKKEYLPTLKGKYPSLNKARNELRSFYDEYFDDDEMSYGGGRCYFNKKTLEVETYLHYEDILFLPNYTEDKCIGVWRDSPIYIIDKYPCPFTKYKLHLCNTGGGAPIKMEGI